MIVCLLLTSLNSCKDDVSQAGSSSLSPDEEVIVCSDTLRNIISDNIPAQPASSTPDSFLLGEVRTTDFGTLNAVMLTQLAAPEGWVYPEASELDSVCLYVYYRSWFGDGNSPMALAAYEIDREPLSYDSVYPSNVPVSRFCSMEDSTRMMDRDAVFSPNRPTDSIYSSVAQANIPFIRLRLSDRYAERMFRIRDFSSQQAFNRQFPGLMLCSSYGASAALYVSTLCITIHYHYTYSVGDETKTLADTKTFYSNKEIKQLSRYEHKNQTEIFERLSEDTTVNYVLSPSNIYCRLTIPMQEIKRQIKEQTQNRNVYVNLAQLQLDVLNGDSKGAKEDNWMRPAESMMLVEESEYEKVFSSGRFTSDTATIYSSLLSEYDTITSAYRYYYDFDLSYHFTQMLHKDRFNDTIRMILVPVDLEFTASLSGNYAVSIRMKQAASATKIRSSRSPQTPMDIEMVYSGFTNTIIGH